MNILITSGGTSERIDRVRSITNHSTGQLGKIIAEQFLEAGHQVTLVTTARAVKPATHPNLKIQVIESVDDLIRTLQPLVSQHQVLIHAMAVSDYTPVYMTGLSQAAASSDLTAFLEKSNSQSKISSQEEAQVLFLKKTPKVISLVKEWNPAIRLIGFKLLVQVPKEELIEVARASLEKNQAELIVANDLAEIGPEGHHAYLVGKDGVEEAWSKDQIAEQLLDWIIKEEDG